VRQARAPAVGFVDVRTFPRSSEATHSLTEGHETSDKPRSSDTPGPGSTAVTVHVDGPPNG